MIYHQQQQQQQLLLNKKLPDFKPIFPYSSIDYRSPFDISNSSFGGLGSLFPSTQIHPSIGSFSSKKFDEINRKHFSSTSSSLSRKSCSDNSKISSYSLPFDPLTFSIIERQRLSAVYASLFSSASQGKNFLPMNNNIQREQFINSLRLSQQQYERGAILNNNPVKTLKTKIDQISSRNNEETKRIKRSSIDSNIQTLKEDSISTTT
jgi:hypothetical protein